MIESNIQNPGVYINEINGFPNAVVPVATAVPAFIGYTPQASYQGKSYLNVAQMITSFADFQAIYCLPTQAQQYSPQYYVVPQKTQPAGDNWLAIGGTCYMPLPDPNTFYYLYNSIRLFYQNGGANAYIVSVGGYGAPSGSPVADDGPVVNPNVQLNDLMGGLAVLLNEDEPTMYICPEATLLSVDDNATLMQSMLQQCNNMQTAISVFDIIGGANPNPATYMNDITTFRTNTGAQGLNYGAAYYPFVGTTIMQQGDIDYTNLFGGDVSQLEPLLNPPSAPNPEAATIIANIIKSPDGASVAGYNSALINASPTYKQLMLCVLQAANLLPPSGGMAGVMTTTDNQYGVWQAPANVSIVGVVSLPIKLTDAQQGDLNVDPSSGKSVNVIRAFNSMGILVWGARTLDGNSQDWRYIQVRRTMTMIEQSCKLAARAYIFQPNTKDTWEAVTTMISSFLTTVWMDGGLMGATAADAFSVACGMGSTMTSEDVLNGILIVTVQVAVVHPAEFIVITFQQQQATSS